MIATGSRARQVEIRGLPDARILTNESLFEQHDAPQHLAIIGSGPIALEMASAFRKLGSRVSIITKDDRVFNASPMEASNVLHESLVEQDVALYYSAEATAYDVVTQTLHVKAGQGTAMLDDVDQVLMALGRIRNIDGLGLERAGVAFDPDQGIAINSYGATNVAGIYAIGDVTPTSHWTHSASAQGRRVVQRIAFPFLPRLGREPVYPNATFSDPQVANVGLMPEQIAQRYHPRLIKTLRLELSDTDKGYTEGIQRGFIQVSVLRLTGRILGATIVGPRASEMIAFFTLAISEGITLYKLFRLVYAYPTYSSGIQKIADTYVRETLPNLHRELADVARFGIVTAWKRVRGESFEVPRHPTSEKVEYQVEESAVEAT